MALGSSTPRSPPLRMGGRYPRVRSDRKSTRLNSSHSQISYAVFCLKKKKQSHLCTVGVSSHLSASSTRCTPSKDRVAAPPSAGTAHHTSRHRLPSFQGSVPR